MRIILFISLCMSSLFLWSGPFDKLEVDFKTDTSIRVLTTQADYGPELIIRNKGKKDISGYVEWSISGTGERLLEQIFPKRRFVVPGKNETKFPLEIPKLYDVYSVTCTFYPNNREVDKAHSIMRQIAYFHPMLRPPHKHFWFSLSGDRDQDLDLEIARLVGAQKIRFGLNWNRIQPQRDQWRWEKYDEKLTKWEKQGIAIQALIGYCARWAAPENLQKKGKPGSSWGEWAKAAPVDMNDWRMHVRELAKHYKGRIFYWEVWNEADWGFFIGTTEEYLQIQKIAYEELKAVDPRNQVMTSGFAVADPKAAGHKRNPGLIQRTLKDAQDYFDIQTHHEHGEFSKFAEAVDKYLIPWQKKFLKTPKPLYFNETAVTSSISQIHQAETFGY